MPNNIGFIEKIKKLWNEKREIIYWVLGVIAVVIAFLYAFISGLDNPSNKVLIDLPLGSSNRIQTNIPSDLLNDYDDENKVDSPVVFLEKEDHRSTALSLVEAVGWQSYQTIDSGEYSTVWQSGESLVEYSSIEQKIFFRFEVPTVLDDLDVGIVGRETKESVFNKAAYFLVGDAYEYDNIKLTQEGTRYTISGNRVVNGIRVETVGPKEYTEYLILDGSGRLLEGEFYLHSFIGEEEEIDIVLAGNLETLLREEEYPADYSKEIPQKLLDAQKDNGVRYGDQISDPFQDMISGTVQIDSIEIVYYFNNMLNPELMPVYRLEGTVPSTYDGVEYFMGIVIYSNALDPDRVYIPE